MNGFYCVRVLFIVLGCAVAWIQHVGVRSVLLNHRAQKLYRLGASSDNPPPIRSGKLESKISLDNFMNKLESQLLGLLVNKLSISNTRTNLKVAKFTPDFLLDVKSITGRYVQLKGETKYQLAYKYSTNEQVKNYGMKEAVDMINNIIMTGMFKSAHFLDDSSLHKLDIKTPPGVSLEYKYKVEKVPVMKKMLVSVEDMVHDRSKNKFISMEAPFLASLGITYLDNPGNMGATVRARVSMTDKLGQIQKFLEILDGMVKATPALQSKAGTEHNVKIVDMGSGLAYLTFAAHSHFVKTFPKLQTLGVERREDLTTRTNGIARELGAEFAGLSFLTRAINDPTGGAQNEAKEVSNDFNHTNFVDVIEDGSVDVLVALHACDTATDDAILYGIQHNASIIVVSPCCHKEVRRQMELQKSDALAAHPLSEVLVHGIYRERQSEMVTDTLRALCLQCMGYDTKIFEFISNEHTAKNTMIAATKRSAPLSGLEREEKQKKMNDLMGSFGIRTLRLSSLLALEDDPLSQPVNTPEIHGKLEPCAVSKPKHGLGKLFQRKK